MTSHYVTQMGLLLQAEVERQLLEDLHHYGVSGSGLTIEWWDACGEGHCAEVWGGQLEEVSDLVVLNEAHDKIAEGWMDFIHGGDGNPLYVYWLFLSMFENGQWRRAKVKPVIPDHVWNRLPDETKRTLANAESYNARWAEEPHILAWKRERDLAG